MRRPTVWYLFTEKTRFYLWSRIESDASEPALDPIGRYIFAASDDVLAYSDGVCVQVAQKS